jgi:hypothetical protein
MKHEKSRKGLNLFKHYELVLQLWKNYNNITNLQDFIGLYNFFL